MPNGDLLALTETWQLLSLCAAERPKTVPTQWVAEARGLLVEPDTGSRQIGDMATRVGVPPWILSRTFERHGLSLQYRAAHA
jgi:hypothetical protein